MLKLQPHVMINGKNKRHNDEKLWKLDETVIIGDQVEHVRLMGDTGATISVVNAEYAKKKYPKAVQKLKRSMTASTAGHQMYPQSFPEPPTVGQAPAPAATGRSGRCGSRGARG